MKFRYEIYRIDYVAQTGYVDQYGLNFKKDWEHICPSLDDAHNMLKSKASFDTRLMKWITGKDYHEGRIIERKTLVEVYYE